MPQGIVIIEIFIAQCQAHDPLTDKVFNPVFHKGRMPLIVKTGSKTATEPQTIIDLLYQDDTAIRTHATPVKTGYNTPSIGGWKFIRACATLCLHQVFL
ncbi:hypothetical protein KOEU_37630 [Komagataeibacter europaeus]|uniref:Uncharacterized protein n=1 Tax=Komagataeibacter europaeus TaxID=33995 RepID=A0A0M0EBU5_KOMEU|nr:hypothetical protein KOEU_37630 [Komagataeibacter europaeus]